MKITMLKGVFIGIPCGLLLVVLQNLLDLPKGVFVTSCWILAAVIVLGAIAFNLIYFVCYGKKVKTAATLLDEGKPQEFIDVLELMSRKAKGGYLQTLLAINLSVGYADLKQYQKAIDLLENPPSRRFSGTVKMVYHLNLCACYFYNGQAQQAMEIYNRGQKDFAVFANSKRYGGNIAVLDAFAAMQSGKMDHAREILEKAKQQWPNPRLLEDYAYLEETLKAKEKKNLG